MSWSLDRGQHMEEYTFVIRTFFNKPVLFTRNRGHFCFATLIQGIKTILISAATVRRAPPWQWYLLWWLQEALQLSTAARLCA